MGGCVNKEKEEQLAPPSDSFGGSSPCWSRGCDGESPNGKIGSPAERELLRLRREVTSLRKENRSLRERMASVMAQQADGQCKASPRTWAPRKARSEGDVRAEAQEASESTASRRRVDFDTCKEGALDPQLLNALLEAAWPSVSEWFERKMRQDVEPAIRQALPAGSLVQFGEECNLGTEPLAMRDLVTTTYLQPGSIEGEDIHNVRIVGELEYRGNASIEAALSAGKVLLTGLTLSGAIVVELIHLVPRPPFFSGIRLYFPNVPEVTVEVGSEMLGLAVNLGFLRGTIARALSDVIAQSVVLPNRLAFALNSDLDPFPLRHPRPQGVLRVAPMEARGLRGPGRMLKVDPYVTAIVGSTRWSTRPAKGTLTPRWDDGDVNDFFVMDWLSQVLHIEVRDADFGLLGSQALKKSDFLGRVEVTIADLVDGQHGSVPCERWLQLEDEEGGVEELGEVRLLVQWRPLAHIRDLSTALVSSPEENHWSLGKPGSAAWVLFVGVYNATMLPPAPDGTRHWVEVSVADSGGPPVEGMRTMFARSRAPVRKDIDALDGLGLSANVVAEALDCDVSRVERYLKQRSQNSANPRQRDHGGTIGSLVDVEWDAPVLLLLTSVRQAKLTATVWRQGTTDSVLSLSRIFSSPSSSTARRLGSVSCCLGELLQCPRFTRLDELLLEGCDDPRAAAASLRLRLQVRPLLSPPAADSSVSQRDRIRRKTLKTFSRSSLTTSRRPSVLARQMTREASLFVDYHTPEHSESAGSDSEANSCGAD